MTFGRVGLLRGSSAAWPLWATLALTVPMAGCSSRGEQPVQPYAIAVRPGESLEAARDAARALPASNRVNGVEIVLAPGVYRRSAELKLMAADAGVVWRSAKGGRAVLCDGLVLAPELFRPVAEGTPRVDAAARPQILVADLSAFKVNYGGVPKREFRAPLPIPEVFVDGQRLQAARWPNEGWATIEKFVDSGTQNNDGGVFSSLGKTKMVRPQPRGGVFGYAGDRPTRWMNAPNVWLHGFWCFDWYDSVIPVAAVNAASNTITLASPHTYGVRRGNPSPRRWRVEHLLEELDAPGEYYVDAAAKRLYLIPPRPLTAASHVVLVDSSRSLVRLEKTANVVFRDIDFTECHADAVQARNCTGVAFERCRFFNVRSHAVTMSNCGHCRLQSCDVHDTGTGGVTIDGGDRKSLTPGGNVVEDCLIRDFSMHCFTYASAIRLAGCGNVARHNEISGAPHMAVGLSGNDHEFAFNVVSNVCLSGDDAAALYKGRNPSCRGNLIRYNFWSEIGSARGHGNAAIYFDDGDGGDRVFGNVFYRCGEPGFGNFGTVFSHGGHSNIVENCIFVECKRPLGSSPWAQKRWSEFLVSPLEVTRLQKEVDIRQPPYTTRYPELKGFLDPEPDEARWNAAYDNVFVNCPNDLPGRKPGTRQPGLVAGRWFTNATDVVFAADPGFRNARAKDFALRANSEVYQRLPNFKPIPFDLIGLKTRAGRFAQ
ncbi:MAG: right-handed parallel beta-helix repeat-containing protein [Kiritimatiellae bacterium]|nr:right-handed parallel beta-helix repeat-containing protein [Kiritimatiellia bacterium]